MRQKTKNHQNQGSIDKKFDFFPQSLSHIPRWVHLVPKTRAKKSHAWAPLIKPIWDRKRGSTRDMLYFTIFSPFCVFSIYAKSNVYKDNGKINVENCSSCASL
jgi:hypothetical protein